MNRLRLFIFYWLRVGVMIVRRKWLCPMFGHKPEFTGYYEAAKQGSSFNKIDQCVRCRMIYRSAPDTVVIRLDQQNPYER